MLALTTGCTALMEPMPVSVADGEPLACPEEFPAYVDGVLATGYGLLTVAAIRDYDTCESEFFGCSISDLALVTVLPLTVVHAAMSYGGFREHRRCERIRDAREAGLP